MKNRKCRVDSGLYGLDAPKTPKQNGYMELTGMTICQPCLCRSGVYTPALFSSVYETYLTKAETRLVHDTGGAISERRILGSLTAPCAPMLRYHSSADGSACGRKENMTDREKVLAWLNHIKEFCQQIIDDVIHHCKTDPEARLYFVRRHDEDILGIPYFNLIENAA